eukprot:scaffold6576_cov258-Alexandrium_tamarense.AAC.1
MESTFNRNERPVHHTPRRRRRNDILEIGIIASLTVGSAFYERSGDECERVAVPIVEGRGTTCTTVLSMRTFQSSAFRRSVWVNKVDHYWT